ncbi:MAG: hypothetical protein EZS28_011892 [Streblomastix strix]|uniref:DUF4817 domain-containing protein n=1 Tax=Streblomastix strix TaxID=222440 RepID=A0A5J4WDR9_9EUKA|nr:MAG: hypothetical protein EZS28_011892 [Streblomastix strix]
MRGDIGGSGEGQGAGGKSLRVELDMELEVFKLMRYNNDVDETKINEKQFPERDNNNRQHRLRSNEMEHLEMESQNTDVTDDTLIQEPWSVKSDYLIFDELRSAYGTISPESNTIQRLRRDFERSGTVVSVGERNGRLKISGPGNDIKNAIEENPYKSYQ